MFKHDTTMVANLSPKAIEHIEKVREISPEKNIKFDLELFIKYAEVRGVQKNITEDLLDIHMRKRNMYVEIKQSDWVNNYSPKLGIGNFLLVELQIPKNKEVDSFWKELYDALGENLKNIEICLRSGDWQKAMNESFDFYQNIKIGDDKKGHEEFKEKFNELMKKDQHSSEGIKNLYDAIWQLSEFTAKYHHSKDKKGELQYRAIAKKEDAYLAYSLALALLNLIGSKISS